jgi:DNA-directed RNA polymerase beta subunit
LKEVSPIPDHTGKELELTFDDYTFGEPKYDETMARYKDATYEAPLHITVTLKNKKTNYQGNAGDLLRRFSDHDPAARSS